MSDTKSKFPNFKELSSMTGKLFKDIKTSVGEIIEDYKKTRVSPEVNDNVSKETKSEESKSDPVKPEENKNKE
ncbi:hypothetical protein [Legionella sp.]|uniref:hypothetical protein n=1 Tax=Legionella sp. TaxID=459 RepID=UPI003C897FFF